jgi:hypothetical protein
VLDGIPAAPRGVPQIEVTFDIDANGIVNVTAMDKGTGKEQHITITSSTNMSQEEIDKAVKDAEKFAEEDKKQKDAVDTKNRADSIIFQSEKTLGEIIGLGAENITIHTLSVKRGSRLRENDPAYYRRNVETVGRMLDIASKMLEQAGFRPYYIYRQKHQIGSYENVGWCRPGRHSIYNIRIMEDKQTIIGLGAGAVGKVYFRDEDRLERIANVSNYEIYSERFDEMLARKDEYYR